MGCHLHDLIEAVDSRKLEKIEAIIPEDFNAITRVFKIVAPQAVCFDMGDIDEFPDIVPVYEMVKVCWFNGNWSFPLFELTYSIKGEPHEKKTQEL